MTAPISFVDYFRNEINLGDDKNLYFGDDKDISIDFTDGTGLQIVGTASAENLILGSATYNMNLTIFGTLTFGASDEGMDVKFWGDTAGSYWEWDADTDTQNIVNGKLVVASTWIAAAVGRPLGVELTLSVMGGNYVNAIKGYVDASSGGTIGLLSAVNCEIKMPTGACAGAFYPLEVEWVGQAGTAFGAPGTGSQSGFIWIGATGTVTDMNADGVFMSVNGLSGATDKLLSANSQTLKCDFDQGTTRYLVFSQIQNGLGLGLTGTPQILTFDGTKQIDCYTTCASTNTGTSYEPQLFNNVLTGAGQVGGRFRVNMSTNYRLGGWANAFKASIECNTNGSTTGVMSVGCFEITLPASNPPGGAMTCAEFEMTCPASGYTANNIKPSFVFLNTTGTTRGVFEDYGALLHFGTGFTATTGNIIGSGYSTLRIGFGDQLDTLRYIPLSTVEETFTTAYPIATTSTIVQTCTTAGISSSASTLHASTGRIGKFVGSVANANQGDGYGVFEVQANFSGTVPSGSVANASSFWINLSGSTVTAGTILCVQNNGIWAPGGLTLSTTTMVIGMRMHCEISGGTQPNEIFCFSTNIVANHITSLWQINVIEDINTTSTKSGDSVAVPWLKTSAGTQYYVNAYTT